MVTTNSVQFTSPWAVTVTGGRPGIKLDSKTETVTELPSVTLYISPDNTTWTGWWHAAQLGGNTVVWPSGSVPLNYYAYLLVTFGSKPGIVAAYYG